MFKKLIYSSALALIGYSSNAQYAIGMYDMPQVGDVVIQANDSMVAPSIVPGGTGNQTWNFAALQNLVEDTIWFTNALWTPYTTDFPSSNLAGIQTGFYLYAINNATGMWLDGQAGDFLMTGSPITIDINPDEQIHSFPENLGTTFNNTSGFDFTIDGSAFGVDSVRVKEKKTKSVDVNAYGDMTTPLGTFTNSIRAYTRALTIDSVWALVPFPPFPSVWTFVQETVDTSWNYSWYKDGGVTRFSIVDMDYDSTTAMVRNVAWLKTNPFPSSVNEIIQTGNVTVYPNPAVDEINFNFGELQGKINLDIFDMTGKLISSETANEKTTVNTSEFGTGIYIFRIQNENGLVNTGRFNVVR